MTTLESLKLWNDNYEGVSKQERINLNLKWIKYWDAIACGSDISSQSAAEAVTKYLVREGLLKDYPTVLDIGCGTGRYSLLLSKLGAKVTALDMSLKVLEVLSNRATSENQDISTVKAMWENFETNEKYDLVFSSLCPAICDEESLLKMESLSNKYCVYIGAGKGSYAKSRAELKKRLNIQKLAGLSPESIYIYNYLYSLGRAPNVRSYTANYKNEVSVEEAINSFILYYDIFGVNGKDVNDTIAKYIKENSTNGKFLNQQKIVNTVVWWEVKA